MMMEKNSLNEASLEVNVAISRKYAWCTIFDKNGTRVNEKPVNLVCFNGLNQVRFMILPRGIIH